eukprot:9473758-Pyramimonas_sp.AAC.1
MIWIIPNTRSDAADGTPGKSKPDVLIWSGIDKDNNPLELKYTNKRHARWMTLWQPRRGKKPAQIMGMQGYIDEAKAAAQFKVWAERYAQGEEKVTLEAEKKLWLVREKKATDKAAAGACVDTPGTEIVVGKKPAGMLKRPAAAGGHESDERSGIKRHRPDVKPELSSDVPDTACVDVGAYRGGAASRAGSLADAQTARSTGLPPLPSVGAEWFPSM